MTFRQAVMMLNRVMEDNDADKTRKHWNDLPLYVCLKRGMRKKPYYYPFYGTITHYSLRWLNGSERKFVSLHIETADEMRPS